MRTNILTAYYKEGELNVIGSLYQYDYGQRIVFADLDLPTAYEVHFSNEERGESYTMIGDSTGVDIPDELLQTGKNVYVWIYLHTGENDGETVYRYIINVRRRAEPIHETPTPVQHNEIEQAIIALNSAVETTAQDVIDANAAKEAAETAQGKAEEAITHEPYIDSTTGNWMKWNIALEQYVDTGVHAQGDKGDTGDKGDKGDTGAVPDIQVGNVITSATETIVTRQAGSPNERPVFDFAIKKGDKGDRGKDFHIAKTFSSIAQMEAYSGTDLEPYDFAMIDTGNVEDPDTGKLYCYMPGINLLNKTTMEATVSPYKKYILNARVTVIATNYQSINVDHYASQGFSPSYSEMYYYSTIGTVVDKTLNIETEQYDIGLRITFTNFSAENVSLTEKWGYIGDLSGKQGIKGETGTGIANIVLNNDYTLTITMDDDPDNPTTYTTGSVRGPQGETGAAGYSPSATVSKTGHTATISITDQTGTTTATVMEPTASVSKSGSTSTITITDSTGTTTAQVTDGATGATGPTGATPHLTIGTVTDVPYGTGSSATITGTDENPVLNLNLQSGQSGNETIDDTAGLGDTDFVWSADKTDKEVIRLDGIKANTDSAFAYKETYGSVVEFDDGVSEAVKRMDIAIAPLQDLHGYEYPWVGGAGKNLFDVGSSASDYSHSFINSVTDTGIVFNIADSGQTLGYRLMNYTASGTFTVSGTATKGYSRVFIRIRKSDDSGWASNSDYSISGFTYNSYYYGWYKDNSTTSINVTFVIPTCLYWQIGFGYANNIAVAGTTESISNIQLESGSTATTYAPYSNICPISGWTGANVDRTNPKYLYSSIPVERKKGVNATTGALETNDYYDTFGFIDVEENAKYTIQVYSSNGYGGVGTYYYADDGTYISREFTSNGETAGTKTVTATIPNGCKKMRIGVARLATSTVDETTLNIHRVYSITFPSSAGTVYGGILTVNQDGTGSLIVDRAIKQVDSSSIVNTSGSFAGRYFTNGNYVTDKKTYGSVLCNAFLGVPADNSTIKCAVYFSNTNQLIFNTNFSTIYDFKTWIDSNILSVVYELASPSTYTLTTDQVLHLLSGQNTVYADCGEITLLYPTDRYLTAEQAERERIHESIAVSAPVQTIDDGADNVPMEMTVGIEPVQDLHGYANPWVGGAGRNLCPDDQAEFTLSGETWVSLKGVNASTYTNGTKVHLTAGTYKRVITNSSTGSISTIQMFDSNGDLITVSNQIFTLASEGDIYIRIKASDSLLLKSFIESDTTATVWTPYENICPISGWNKAEVTRTGKNLLDWKLNTFANTNPITLKAGTYTISGESTFSYGAWYIRGTKANGTYCTKSELNLSTWTASSTSGVFYGANNATTVTFTVPENDVTIELGTGSGNGTIRSQLEQGSTATSFEAYKGRTYSVTFPSSAGTVYGGSLTVNKDGTGTLVVNRGFVTDMGELSYLYDATYTRFYANIVEMKRMDTRTMELVCSAYRTISDGRAIGNVPNNSIYNGANQNQIYIKTDQYTDPTAFKTAIAGQTLVYDLATPVTYTIPAPVIRFLLGTNSIFCDTGNVLSVNYAADTKLYISKELDASRKLMELIITANREDSMKATKAYTTGNLMIVNGTLYKATTSIANGATLTVGTNVTATTVVAEIAALS